jgi:hypothetical protein
MTSGEPKEALAEAVAKNIEADVFVVPENLSEDPELATSAIQQLQIYINKSRRKVKVCVFRALRKRKLL